MICKRLIMTALCASLSLTSCAAPMPDEEVGTSKSDNTVQKTTVLPIAAAAAEPVGETADERFTNAVSDFSAKLFKACAEKSDKTNLVVSPLSVVYAMTLLSNGAAESTLEAFESLNGGISVEEMNEYLFELAKTLSSTDESTVDTANSVWANEPRFTISDDFVTVAEKYYDALAKSVDFSDDTTLDTINKWVSENTDGMIENALDELDPAAAMILINTVLFNGKWEEPYEENDIRDGKFTNADGSTSEVRYMDSDEDTYFETENGVGFVKSYKDGYSFVGILPNEDIDIERFTAELDLAKINSAINESESAKVYVSLPKFEYENELPLKEILSDLGLSEAFGVNANLCGLGSGNVGEAFLGDVLQKARIITDENGTKAAAMTEAVVLMRAMMPLEQPKYIELDRPFFYMIVENETMLPLFMGTVCEFE